MRVIRFCLMFLLAVFLALPLAGCDTNDTVTGAKVPRLETPSVLPDGTINFKNYQVLYTRCGTFVLSYPSDFDGPIPEGYGRIGQTDPDYYCGSNSTFTIGDPTDGNEHGDPTADDVQTGDPDTPESGEGDGAVIK